MTPETFLSRWKLEHINAGTQQADAPDLVESLLAGAAEHGIGRDMLIAAAGGGLVNYVVDAIREAIEEDLR